MGAVEDFETLVADIDSPLYVVTAAAGAERAGCLVGFATQTSIHPPRFLVLVSKLNHTFGVATAAEGLAVHVLGRSDLALARHFGEETGDEVDKFAGCAWREGPFAAPILDGVRGWFAGRVLQRWDAGDHVAHLLEPVEVGLGAPDVLLTRLAAGPLSPGHPA